jgi:membrane-associated protein
LTGYVGSGSSVFPVVFGIVGSPDCALPHNQPGTAMDFMQLLDMILHVDKTLGTLLAQYGPMVYAVLAAIVFCETGLVVMPFLPGDTLLFIAGAFCATGAMNIWLLLGLLICCAVAGNTVNYWIGQAIGHKVFTRDYRWIDRQALQKTHDFFEKHGGKTIILARFVPIVRTFAPFVAGVSEMTFVRFQLYNITGAVLWVVGLVVGGYFFGNIPIIRDHLNAIVLLGIGAAVIPLVLGGLWKLYKRVTG